MLDGEKLKTFDSPVEAAAYYTPSLSREMLENHNIELVRLLQRMRAEREDIFEKNTALEDACGKLMKEKVYLQQQLAGAINAFSESHKRMEARYDELIARQSQATASDQTGQEHR